MVNAKISARTRASAQKSSIQAVAPRRLRQTHLSHTPTKIATLNYSAFSPVGKRKFLEITEDFGQSNQVTPSLSFKKPKIESDDRSISFGLPLVWADNRSDLCSALSYFKAYQGGTYTKNGIAWALLLDEDCTERQFIGEEIVIARAGGGMGTDESGKTVLMTDQDPASFRIQAFKNSMGRKIPLMVIIGNKNKYCPSKIPYRYCVLGAFHLTYIWAEKSNDKILFKFRLEKVDVESKSWWAAGGPESLPESQVSGDVKAYGQTCDKCDTFSKQVYQIGWMCLEATCEDHWKLNNAPPPAKLEFNKDFTLERTAFGDTLPPYQVIPELPKVTGLQTVARSSWKGIVCPKCGRCNQRVHWDAWRCENEKCDFKLSCPPMILPASAVSGDSESEYHGHAISEDAFTDEVRCQTLTHGCYTISEYHLPKGLTVTHVHANSVINRQPGGADDAFERLQREDLGLQRLKIHSMTSGSRSAHFSANFGVPYKYSVAHKGTTDLQAAPSEIIEGLRRMQWASKRVDGATSFNECLAVGYFQGCKMGYHDDGEPGLGPNVASWSLGGPSNFNFRMKSKYYSGFIGNNYHPKLDVLPGSYEPDIRRDINAKSATMNQDALNAYVKDHIKLRKAILAPPCLKLKLRHGDIVTMHGADLQKYYEHTANPEAELRFALTCRYIEPKDDEQRRQGRLDLDPSNNYDGDLAAYNEMKAEHDAANLRASQPRPRPSAASNINAANAST